jgi:nucleoside phosphorylase
MNRLPFTLVCFAVKEEAECFHPPEGVKTLLTGMGRRNAEEAFRRELQRDIPGFVLTCGFAGGLKPELAKGAVMFSLDDDPRLESVLAAAGAKPGSFHCAEKVATTAEQKRRLRETTGADAVEMESQIIRAICREHKIPSATIRVILDTAGEDLALDFNELMTASQKMHYGKLALALLRSPGKIPALMELQRQSRAAAEKLAEVLRRILGDERLKVGSPWESGRGLPHSKT